MRVSRSFVWGFERSEKIISVIEMYERNLVRASVPKVRMNPNRTFAYINSTEILAHAHFLCDGAKKLAVDPKRQRMAGSHLTAIQMCLSFAGWYTLKELQDHNKNRSWYCERFLYYNPKVFN